MMLLGVDLGTTHCKAGLFDADGSALALAQRQTPMTRGADGSTMLDPEALWHTASATIRDVVTQRPSVEIAGIGIASMAETGTLLDRRSGVPRHHLIPWFDRGAAPFAAELANASDRFERFCATGQYPSFKSPLAKILALRAEQPAITAGAVWLSAADYIAYRLTGSFATDYSLAARSYAFRIDQAAWDTDWLHAWSLDPDLFPPALPSGTSLGGVQPESAKASGLSAGTPVVIAGHDHVCAALAAGVVDTGPVFDSMGTAETLVGALPMRPIGRTEFDSGLTYGRHVVPGRLYWMGGLSASGGSLEWLRQVLGDPPVAYDELRQLVEQAGPDPTGIMYLPYLLGSGTPHPDAHIRGAFVGLRADHTRAHLAKAVLEGTAFELEYIRRAAKAGTGAAITRVVAAGGGVQFPAWMQIKADICGFPLEAAALGEATLLGAALLAGIGVGGFRDAAAAIQQLPRPTTIVHQPDPTRHRAYQHLYEAGYLALQSPLRQLAPTMTSTGAP